MKLPITIAVAAVLISGELFAAPAAGDGSILDGEWEVTVRKEVPKEKKEIEPEKPVTGEGEEKEVIESVPEPETVLRIRAEVLGFGKEGIRIRPAVAPESVLEFSAAQLVAVNRLETGAEKPAEEKPKEVEGGKEDEEVAKPAGHTVTLSDGAYFTGKLVSFDVEKTVLESEPYGAISIPTGAILTITNEGLEQGETDTFDEVQTTTVYLESGEVFKGDLGADSEEAGYLTIQGILTKARFPLSAVAMIVFPNGTKSAESEEERTEFEIALSDGGRMTCSRVDFNNGLLSMSMRSGVNIQVPMGQVGSIYPVQAGGGISGSGVLLWGGYSDPEEEYDHARTAVQAGGSKMDEIKTGVPGSDFRRRLFRSQAFVIPELEKLNAATLNAEVDVDGKKMKLRDYVAHVMRPDLERFWSSGGHVICLGIQGNHFEFLKLLGIDGVKTATDKAGDAFKIPPDVKRRLRMEHDTLQSANATHAYDTPKDWETFAGQDGKRAAAVISKRIRRGRITLMGTDYYESNPSIDEMLQKLIRLRQ